MKELYNCKSLGTLSQKIQKMMNANFYQMKKESEQFASEYKEIREILADRYEQEMIKAVSNIRYELNKSESPFLGKDLAPIIDESLTVVDISYE